MWHRLYRFTYVAIDNLGNSSKVAYVIEGRRAGDIGVCYSDPSKAMREINWKAEYGLEEMCRDSWNWERNNNSKTDE